MFKNIFTKSTVNKIHNNASAANTLFNFGSGTGTELTAEQGENVNGGFLPLLIIGAALLSGCAHCQPYVKK